MKSSTEGKEFMGAPLKKLNMPLPPYIEQKAVGII